MLGTATALALLALAACSGSSSPPGDTAVTPPTISAAITNPTSWIAANTALPLMAYDQSQRDQATVLQAQTILDVNCMHKQGFTDFTTADITVIQNDAASAAAYRAAGAYGYVDEPSDANARAHGFHHVTALATGGGTPLPTVERTALDKCVEQARTTVSAGTGSATTGTSLVNQLLAQAQNLAAADKRVQAASTAWANCMKTQGFGTATDPNALATQQWNGSPNPTSAEVAMAVADADCTRSSNLSGTYFAVEAGYQNELIQANQLALGAIQTANQTEVSNAAKIVGGS